jgi:hypothetical protein
MEISFQGSAASGALGEARFKPRVINKSVERRYRFSRSVFQRRMIDPLVDHLVVIEVFLRNTPSDICFLW